MREHSMEPMSGERSDLAFDGMRYELVTDDWQSRAVRLQDQRWHLLRKAGNTARSIDGHQ